MIKRVEKVQKWQKVPKSGQKGRKTRFLAKMIMISIQIGVFRDFPYKGASKWRFEAKKGRFGRFWTISKKWLFLTILVDFSLLDGKNAGFEPLFPGNPKKSLFSGRQKRSTF